MIVFLVCIFLNFIVFFRTLLCVLDFKCVFLQFTVCQNTYSKHISSYIFRTKYSLCSIIHFMKGMGNRESSENKVRTGNEKFRNNMEFMGNMEGMGNMESMGDRECRENKEGRDLLYQK